MLRSFVERIGIRTKFILVFALPVTALISLSAMQAERMWAYAENMRVAREMIGASIDISQLANDLQRERGLSGGYIGSRGRQFHDQIRNQRQATDRTIASLSGFSELLPDNPDFANVKASWADILKSLEDRPAIQAQVDALLEASEYWSWYTGMIRKIINLIQKMPVSHDDLELSQRVHAYTILLWLEERSGQERGLMNRIIAAGNYAPESVRTVTGYIAQQEALIEEFKVIATDEEWRALYNVLTGPEGRQIENLRQSITYRLVKKDLLKQLQSQIGYGGFIHHFKNYLLRGSERYYRLFLEKDEAAQSIIAEYRSLPNLSTEEQKAIDDIERILVQYSEKLHIITEMQDAGKLPLAIDKVVIVDDKPALEAVETLRRHIVPTDAEAWFDLTTARLDQITIVRNDIKSAAIGHMNDVARQASLALIVYVVGICFVLGILLVLGSAISRRVSRGIASISQTLKNVEKHGDYSETVPLDGSDEIGDMALRINNHLSALNGMFHDVAAILESAASGEFSKPERTGRPGDLGKLMRGVETSTQKIEKVMEAQRQTAESLSVARIDAEQANQAKSEFLSSISHDLRTPLNAILGLSEIMKGQMFGPLGDPHYEEYASHIHDSGKFLLDLVNDILDLSKAEAGKFELVESAMDVGACIETSARLISPLTDRKNIHLSVDIPADLPPFLGDERTITQIINNLLSNAVKFTDENGKVLVSARINEQGGVDIRVADSGIGMSQDEILQVMKPFVQADSTLSHKQEGTGLGLSLCKTFVELHGGTLTIESAPGKGTTITARFPPERSTSL